MNNKIKARLIKAYWKYLNAAKDHKKNMWYWYNGTKHISVLFISSDEILELEKKTEGRFERHIQKIDPEFNIKEVI